MRKLRFREGKSLAQGHTASGRGSPPTQVCLTLMPIFLLYPSASWHTGMGDPVTPQGTHGLDLFSLAGLDSLFFQCSQRSFIHSATICLLNAHCVPGTVLGAGDTMGSRQTSAPSQSSWPGQEAGVESLLQVSLRAHAIPNHFTKQPLLESMPKSPGVEDLPLAAAWLTGPFMQTPGSHICHLLLPGPQEDGQFKDLHPPLWFAGSHLGQSHPQSSCSPPPRPRNHQRK